MQTVSIVNVGIPEKGFRDQIDLLLIERMLAHCDHRSLIGFRYFDDGIGNDLKLSCRIRRLIFIMLRRTKPCAKFSRLLRPFCALPKILGCSFCRLLCCIVLRFFIILH